MSIRNGLNFFELFYFLFGIDHDPHAHMIYVYSISLMFHFSHEYVAKRSHYRIMIFYNFGVLFYGRTPTLILFHFLHNPTTPILPVYIGQQWTHLEKNTTQSRGMIIREVLTVPGRTLLTPD